MFFFFENASKDRQTSNDFYLKLFHLHRLIATKKLITSIQTNMLHKMKHEIVEL